MRHERALLYLMSRRTDYAALRTFCLSVGYPLDKEELLALAERVTTLAMEYTVGGTYLRAKLDYRSALIRETPVPALRGPELSKLRDPGGKAATNFRDFLDRLGVSRAWRGAMQPDAQREPSFDDWVSAVYRDPRLRRHIESGILKGVRVRTLHERLLPDMRQLVPDEDMLSGIAEYLYRYAGVNPAERRVEISEERNHVQDCLNGSADPALLSLLTTRLRELDALDKDLSAAETILSQDLSDHTLDYVRAQTRLLMDKAFTTVMDSFDPTGVSAYVSVAKLFAQLCGPSAAAPGDPGRSGPEDAEIEDVEYTPIPSLFAMRNEIASPILEDGRGADDTPEGTDEA